MKVTARLGKNGTNAVIPREHDYVLAKLIRKTPEDKNAKVKVCKITDSKSDAISWLEEE